MKLSSISSLYPTMSESHQWTQPAIGIQTQKLPIEHNGVQFGKKTGPEPTPSTKRFASLRHALRKTLQTIHRLVYPFLPDRFHPTPKSIPTEYAIFEKALTAYGKPLSDWLSECASPENVLGSGAVGTFLRIPQPGFEDFGIKIFDRNKANGLGMMFSNMLNQSFSLDLGESRLKDFLTNSDTRQYGIRPARSRLTALPRVGRDIAEIINPQGHVLGVIQNRIPGKSLSDLAGHSPLLLATLLINYSDPGLFDDFVAFHKRHKTLLRDISEKTTVEEVQKILPRLDAEGIDLLERLKPVGTFLDFKVALLPEPERKAYKQARSLGLAAAACNRFPQEYNQYLRMLADTPQTAYDELFSNLELLRQRRVKIDVDQHANNVFYDPQSQRFGLIDVHEGPARTAEASSHYVFEEFLPVFFQYMGQALGKKNRMLLPALMFKLTQDPNDKTAMQGHIRQILQKAYQAAENAGTRTDLNPADGSPVRQLWRWTQFRP